ncbi:MAG: hypothetical protein NTZ09_05165 [Candidatus Hydrogenedentes bacterium]|nr:hypothetical protein [Candidatus Hydrogenedentota bacterium]
MKTLGLLSLLLGFAGICVAAEKPSVAVGPYKQEVFVRYGASEGFDAGEANAVAVVKGGVVYAGTPAGLYIFENGKWSVIDVSASYNVEYLAATGSGSVLAVAEGGIYEVNGWEPSEVASVPPDVKVTCIASCGPDIYLGTMQGLYKVENGSCVAVEGANALLDTSKAVRAVAGNARTRAVAVAALDGLLINDDGEWRKEAVREGSRSWLPFDVRGVAYDREARLWFASAQGVGYFEDGEWTLFTPADGLPYDDFTMMCTGEPDVMWFGTNIGAIRYDEENWAYRQGPGWLPHDVVRSIAVNENGDAFFATPGGVGAIERRSMTLAEKAKFYEDEIDKYNRRTPYGYVLEASLKSPGDKTGGATQHDSDNDGLWTAMYGAGECYAWAATKDLKAKERAKNAFEALRFLGVVTQGGTPPALPGFVARSILPTSGRNPNESDTRERDKASQARGDKKWKVMSPRWPTSADGQWYWKSDTSSDELDGHYWFYGLYYDLVADTEEEKQHVRDVVVAITDHLIAHDFALVDWDGEPTRWAVYGPGALNSDPAWFPERGLNSLSILSYLSTAAHVSGDAKYHDAADKLVREHGYAMNIMYPKLQYGPGSMNQSDDEMAFMSYYNLVKYARDPMVRAMASFSFHSYWTLEEPELNPLFNFMYAGANGERAFDDPYGRFDLSPKGDWLAQSVDTLERFPLDRCNWSRKNSHRKDILPLEPYKREGRGARGCGYRTNGYVIPVDERHFNHWNTDPWELDYGGQGTELADGAVFLTPYYMGLYHGFIKEQAP